MKVIVQIYKMDANVLYTTTTIQITVKMYKMDANVLYTTTTIQIICIEDGSKCVIYNYNNTNNSSNL